MKSRNKKKSKLTASNFDPLGSYTGNYLGGNAEEPVQDVDDL